MIANYKAPKGQKENMEKDITVHVVVEVAKNDRRKVEFHHHEVTGRQIMEKAGVPLREHEELFSFRDGKFHLVRNDETVVIRENEHFVVIPRGDIRYSVNDEPEWTKHKELTPVEIMNDAGVDSETNYLTEIKHDHKKESFKDKPNERIHMHDDMKFITTFVGPKPVSNW